MKTKKTYGIIAVIFLALLAINLASAEFWQCMQKGDRVEYCNNYKAPRSCSSDLGCQLCMLEYRAGDNCYIHGSWPRCNSLGNSCFDIGNGSGGIDGEAPQFVLSSPTNGELFASRKALVEFSLNEPADIYYLDVVNGRGKWSKLCSNCDAPGYSKLVSFDEGSNQIIFKAVDKSGNSANQSANFFIDSKKPKISSTLPKKGFANGEFEVKFSEENPKTLILHYGSDTKTLDLVSDCVLEKTSQLCDTSVNLGSYDGQDIEYWFTLEDLVGTVVESKHVVLSVDITAPVVNNPSSFFTYETGTKYVYFNLSINEQNFDSAFYTYLDERGKLKEKSLCSKLKDGSCYKKVSFKEGAHDLTVSVLDEAGNSIGLPASFVVDY